jgi:hypothetical protein
MLLVHLALGKRLGRTQSLHSRLRFRISMDLGLPNRLFCGGLILIFLVVIPDFL